MAELFEQVLSSVSPAVAKGERQNDMELSTSAAIAAAAALGGTAYIRTPFHTPQGERQ